MATAAGERTAAAGPGEAPLPALTPHGLRRSFASLLYGIREPPRVVMQELGHTDPALALSIYAHAMRRDDGEDDRLRALVGGADLRLERLGETTSERPARGVDSDHGQRAEVEGWLARPDA